MPRKAVRASGTCSRRGLHKAAGIRYRPHFSRCREVVPGRDDYRKAARAIIAFGNNPAAESLPDIHFPDRSDQRDCLIPRALGYGSTPAHTYRRRGIARADAHHYLRLLLVAGSARVAFEVHLVMRSLAGFVACFAFVPRDCPRQDLVWSGL